MRTVEKIKSFDRYAKWEKAATTDLEAAIHKVANGNEEQKKAA